MFVRFLKSSEVRASLKIKNWKRKLKFLSDCNCRKGKGKLVPLEARGAPEGSRKLRFPDYVTMAQDGGKVVSLTDRPLISPSGNIPGTHFFRG
jgi:hypothetical protein